VRRSRSTVVAVLVLGVAGLVGATPSTAAAPVSCADATAAFEARFGDVEGIEDELDDLLAEHAAVLAEAAVLEAELDEVYAQSNERFATANERYLETVAADEALAAAEQALVDAEAGGDPVEIALAEQVVADATVAQQQAASAYSTALAEAVEFQDTVVVGYETAYYSVIGRADDIVYALRVLLGVPPNFNFTTLKELRAAVVSCDPDAQVEPVRRAPVATAVDATARFTG
jgi:hypothetical protein